MNVIQALADPHLFGALPRFRDLRTWRAWIVFLKALFALPMDDDELALYRQCTGRTQSPAEEVQEAAAVVGRRGGKSIVAALIAVSVALLRDWRPHLSPGERAHVVVIAQNQRAAHVVLNYIRAFLRSIPVFSAEVMAERVGEIDLRNGVTIGVWPCTYKAARGLTIVVAILDEIDFWWQESINAAQEVVAAVRPALATLPGSKLLALSSPYTSVGWLHGFHRQHFGQDGPYLVWKAASRVMNPTLSEEKIAAAIAEDPQRGRSEWEAEWRSGVSAFVDGDLLDACVRSEPRIIPPLVGPTYGAGCDPAGGGADQFAWAIAHRDRERVIIDLVKARGRQGRQGFDLEATVRECVGDLRQYSLRTVVGDRFAGQWVAEAFAREKITYRYAERPKSDLYLELLPLFTTRRLHLPDDPDLIRQIRLLERRQGSQGKDRIDHVPGAHDDLINAVALACQTVVGAAALVRPAAARLPSRGIPGVTLGRGWGPRW